MLFSDVSMLSSYRYFVTLITPFPCMSLHSGYCDFRMSVSITSTAKKFRLFCMSLIPGSQKMFRTSISMMSMSPSPFIFWLFHRMP